MSGTRLIILDWDDTILPSSWVAGEGLRLDEPHVLPARVTAKLQPIEDKATKLIQRACELGTVIVITNAETGWVELSAKRFLPAVVPLLGGVKVVSARSEFEASYPSSPQQWKMAAFGREIRQALAHPDVGDAQCTVASLGDSVHEREALHSACRALKSPVVTKSVKFIEHPGLEQLEREMECVTRAFEDIVSPPGNVDLALHVNHHVPENA